MGKGINLKGKSMYTEEQLKKYPYFANIIKDTGMQGMLDQLTGLLTRGYILWFAQWLIEHKIPFSFAIMDLDNFKFVNDTYGHHIGDGVLVRVAEDLAEALDGIGLAGRFGGDEMLIVNLRDITYDNAKAFFTGIYGGKVLRKNIRLEGCSPFITATVGCAIYPTDAQDYEKLFGLIDKTLYRGKTKGRNCHIIYVEEKHKDIVIRQIARRGMYTVFSRMIRQFELVPGLMNKLYSIVPLLMEELQISDLYYVGSSGMLRSVRNSELAEPVPDVEKLMQSEDLFSDNTLEKIRLRSPELYRALHKMEIETVCVVRIGMDMDTDGYLICAEPRNRRIWQEAECAMLYFLAKMLAARIRIEGEKLE